MPFDTRAAVVREAISRLGHDRLEPHELLVEAAHRIRRVVPYDMGGWMTIDPDSLLPTGTMRSGKPPALVRQLWFNEIETADLNHFPTLLREDARVATLCSAAPERLERSARYQLHLDSGLTDEARVLLRGHDGALWGAACLHREHGSAEFSVEDRRFLHEVAGDLGEALQKSLLQTTDSEPLPDAPGVVLMDDDLNVETMTEEAASLLRLMPGDAVSTLYGVAAGQTAGTRPARVRVRLSDGRWLLLHAAHMPAPGSPKGRIAVVVERAGRHDMGELMLRLHGLSAREQEVTRLLWKGLDTGAIAAQLHISRYTLRDHVKAIFGKLGVSSRAELMALGTKTAEV
jgi:DNA-binding CsgD family transcriptional regulator